MNFRESLISTYCENPCQVLPNALWKTLAQLQEMQTSVSSRKDIVVQLKAWNERILLVCWTSSREQSQGLFREHIEVDLALIHQDYLDFFPAREFTIRKPYFRLIHRQNESEIKKAPFPNGFKIVEVSIQQECQEVANFIGQCYQDKHPTIETITDWTKHPTFDPSLWIWVFDNAKGVPVGLGIAEIDTGIPEGSLEWIQVLPNYRGMGVGKIIVQELLSRLGNRVKFTTVAGEINNPTKPEALYRSCGFKGKDIWWMFATE